MLLKKSVIIKIIISLILLSFCTLITPFYNESMAEESGESGGSGKDGTSLLGEINSDIKNFSSAGSSFGSGSIDTSGVTDKFVALGQVLTMIGTGVMVAVTTYMGIKYLTAGPEAQAKLKTQLIGVVVAGIVIFGAYSIWSLVVNIASQF